MGSTNIPSKEDPKKVRIQCETPDDGLLNFDIDASKLQALFTILVDCKYRIAGCITNDYAKDIKLHEGRCLYRSISCPVKSKEDLCEDVLAMNLVEHMTEHHNEKCISAEENNFSLPIDLDKDIQLSRMVTIHGDILLCHLKSEDYKLHISILSIRNTNAQMSCEMTLMADDVKWSNHNIQVTNSDSGFTDNNGKSVVFDLEKLHQVKNIFNNITVCIECSIATQETTAQSEEFLQKIICGHCGDFLTSVYYECENKHLHCEACYVSKESWFKRWSGKKLDIYYDKCRQCNSDMVTNKQSLTVIDSLQTYEYPCKNHALGCKQYIPRFKSNHELLCPFKVFMCAIDECKFSGKLTEFIKHLQENHTNEIANTNVYNFNFRFSGFSTTYMFAFGSVFCCKISNWSSGCKCSIEWISTPVLRKQCSFEVTFIYGEGKTLTLRTNSDPRGIYFEADYYRSVYNTITKTATFQLYEKEMKNVSEVTFTIHKKSDVARHMTLSYYL